MREIKLLRATSHEHVVSVIEAFRSQSSGNVYLVRFGSHCVDRVSLVNGQHRTKQTSIKGLAFLPSE